MEGRNHSRALDTKITLEKTTMVGNLGLVVGGKVSGRFMACEAAWSWRLPAG